MPKNQAPGRCASKDGPPRSAPTTIAVVPSAPRSAVRAKLICGAGCTGASGSAMSVTSGGMGHGAREASSMEIP